MLRVANERFTFSIHEALKHKVDKEDCFRVEIIDDLVLEGLEKYVRNNPLEEAFLIDMRPLKLSEKVTDEEVAKCVY